MHNTIPAPSGATPRESLFGAPALRRPASAQRSSPPVSAYATGSFRLGQGQRVVEVDVHVSGLTFSCMVRDGRVVPPMLRGERAIHFTDRQLAEQAHRAAVEAAQDAERRGWLA